MNTMRSEPTRESRYAAVGVLEAGFMSASDLGHAQGLAQARILQGIGRVAVEILDEHCGQDTADEGEAAEVENIDVKPARMDDGHDVKGHVAEMHDPGPGAKGDHDGQGDF